MNNAEIAMNPPRKTLLFILDGMGLNEDPEKSATTAQHMPYVHSLMDTYGSARLEASGTAVGLDEGQAGNSEIGHMTIGAGEALLPTLEKIRRQYHSGEWLNNPVWSQARSQEVVHIVGLISDAGIHGHWQTLAMAAHLAVEKGFKKVFIHGFFDGVDSQAGSGPAMLAQLQTDIAKADGKIILASLMGRKWATDRSGNWATTETCVNALMDWQNSAVFDLQALAQHLENNTSEANFPHSHFADGMPIKSGDDVILTSHRADRSSQLAKCLDQQCHVFSMVELKHEAVKIENVFFPTQSLDGGLIDTVKNLGIATVRLAEQCKFPHVTYFINGMKADEQSETFEVPTIADEKILTQPTMSIEELTHQLEAILCTERTDVLGIVNVPNLDQVGHQGNLDAAIAAAHAVDELVKKIVPWCQQYQWQLLITADHGNADCMRDDAGQPLGSHSANPVPMVVVPQGRNVSWTGQHGSLANIAASILTLLGLAEATPETWSKSLIELN